MSRTFSIVAVCVAGLLGAAPVAGCGGSDDNGSGVRTTAPGAETKPPRLASADRRAFARIQSASGTLRAAAVPVAYGAAPGLAANRISRATSRVSATRPRNPQLRRLRATTLEALGAFASAGTGASAKAAATRAIADADRIDAGLRRYAASHPAANDIGP